MNNQGCYQAKCELATDRGGSTAGSASDGSSSGSERDDECESGSVFIGGRARSASASSGEIASSVGGACGGARDSGGNGAAEAARRVGSALPPWPSSRGPDFVPGMLPVCARVALRLVFSAHASRFAPRRLGQPEVRHVHRGVRAPGGPRAAHVHARGRPALQV